MEKQDNLFGIEIEKENKPIIKPKPKPKTKRKGKITISYSNYSTDGNGFKKGRLQLK